MNHRSNGRFLFWSLALQSLPLGLLLLAVGYWTDFTFTYSLDDPYIHLALARNIALGHYGINSAEASAPSSSILWPYLLAPFAGMTGVFEYVPLIFNLACWWGTAYVLNQTFASLDVVYRFLLTSMLLVCLNTYGLVFTGMEHSLQVLLVAMIMKELIHPASRKRLLICALLLPLVRYEGLAVSAGVLLYIFLRGERRAAVLTGLLIVGCVGGFSYFLHRQGLGWLPSSVLAKSSHATWSTILENLATNLKNYWFILPVTFLIAKAHWTTDRPFSWFATVVTVLHFLFGRHGWYGRYEIYFLYAIMIPFLFQLAKSPNPRRRYAFLYLPLFFPRLAMILLTTALACSNIRNQQGRMADIAALLDEPVAVNDLGLVALKSKQYVLDLWGLGSYQALEARRNPKRDDWVESLMAQKNVKYAMVYDDWFPTKPGNWKKAGELVLDEKVITPYSDRVTLYGTDEASVTKLKEILSTYSDQHRSKQFHIQMVNEEPGHDIEPN